MTTTPRIAPGPAPQTDHPFIDRSPPIPRHAVDPDAIKVVRRLQQFGYESYIVGGAVRDFLLGDVPKDYDVATAATPRDVRRVFRNCRLIGRRFRLAHVFFQAGKVIEVATFRGEDPAVRTRDDSEGFKYGSARQDSALRDFTINALFYDPLEHVVIDHVRGYPDIERRVLRVIGNPRQRLRDDPVRIVRGIKTAARLGLTIERETAEAMVEMRQFLKEVSPRRLLEEIIKVLTCGAAGSAFRILKASGVLPHLIPEIGRGDPPESVFRHLDALDRRPREIRGVSLALATLFLPVLRQRVSGDPDSAVEIPRLLAEGLIQEFGHIRSLARADRGSSRDLILMQHLLAQGPGSRWARATSRRLMKRPLFREGLELLRISLDARGWDVAVAEEWERALGEGPPAAERESRGPAGDGEDLRGGDGTGAARPRRGAWRG